MPVLPDGVVVTVVANPISLPGTCHNIMFKQPVVNTIIVTTAMVDYNSPFIIPPANYPATGMPGVLRATVPWDVSPMIFGAGIITGFQFSTNTFSPLYALLYLFIF